MSFIQEWCQSTRNATNTRRLSVLLVLASWFALAIAAEGIQLAGLMPAPNIPPAVQSVPARVAPAPEEVHPARRALDQSPIYDEGNPAYYQLQRIDDATRHLPRDPLGFPDWMSAIRSGAITPRANILGTEKMNILDQDVIMRNTKEMPFVRFPHRSHTAWLDCTNCHPTPFLPKTGTNTISMTAIFRGDYCGMCHDRVAFISYFSCSRCHSIARDGPGLPKN